MHNPMTARHRCRAHEAMVVIVLLSQLIRQSGWKAKFSGDCESHIMSVVPGQNPVQLAWEIKNWFIVLQKAFHILVKMVWMDG